MNIEILESSEIKIANIWEQKKLEISNLRESLSKSKLINKKGSKPY